MKTISQIGPGRARSRFVPGLFFVHGLFTVCSSEKEQNQNKTGTSDLGRTKREHCAAQRKPMLHRSENHCCSSEQAAGSAGDSKRE